MAGAGFAFTAGTKRRMVFRDISARRGHHPTPRFRVETANGNRYWRVVWCACKGGALWGGRTGAFYHH